MGNKEQNNRENINTIEIAKTSKKVNLKPNKLQNDIIFYQTNIKSKYKINETSKVFKNNNNSSQNIIVKKGI